MCPNFIYLVLLCYVFIICVYFHYLCELILQFKNFPWGMNKVQWMYFYSECPVSIWKGRELSLGGSPLSGSLGSTSSLGMTPPSFVTLMLHTTHKAHLRRANHQLKYIGRQTQQVPPAWRLEPSGSMIMYNKASSWNVYTNRSMFHFIQGINGGFNGMT